MNPSESAVLILLAGAAMIVAAAPASAHDTWLLPDRFRIAPASSVTSDLTSGVKFPELEAGPKRERVQAARVRCGGQTLEISELTEAPHSLKLKTPLLTKEGVAVFWVVLPSKAIELKPEEVKEYLEEIDPPAAVRQQWAEMNPQRWRELYTKHEKTFVRVGKPASDDQSWSEPVGSALEIIPEKDPTALQVGDEFPIRVLKNGQPYPDFALNALAAGEAKGESRRTDAEGRITFRLSKAGAWLLRGTDLRQSAREDADWESDFVTLTLEVRSK
ncbi:MAG: DUF4198 domain-containing protein [Chthoniobacterales bacterium]